jgi:inorganic triphosphatase YgiF
VVDANRTLEQALALLLKDALARLQGQTLVYDRRFANSRDEYAHELARNRSYESLVPLAIAEYRPSREAQALIERYVRQSRALRERAESQAAPNDHAQAILSLVEGTDSLQRALQASGLTVPQTMGAKQ